ncbi:hypothetical protein [Paracoccus sp. N5]|uniref:hypothetical protein n=1 Tax=Paracoccus sp. N5 TaxID=1101189 RepID=UPI0003738B77|nr:hypothetical protein [Paracoccus sp. N5]
MIDEAMQAIDARNEQARWLADLFVDKWTDERIEKARQRLFIGFRTTARPQSGMPAADGPGRSIPAPDDDEEEDWLPIPSAAERPALRKPDISARAASAPPAAIPSDKKLEHRRMTMRSPADITKIMNAIRKFYIRTERDNSFGDHLDRLLSRDAEGNPLPVAQRFTTTRETCGVMVIDEPGGGKSTLIDRALRRHPALNAGPEGQQAWLAGSVPSPATFKSMIGHLLEQWLFSDPRPPGPSLPPGQRRGSVRPVWPRMRQAIIDPKPCAAGGSSGLQPVRVGPAHHLTLISRRLNKWDDIAHELSVLVPEDQKSLLAQAGTAPVQQPSSLQNYVLARLEGRSGPAWADGQGIEQVARATEMLGGVLEFGKQAKPAELLMTDWNRARNKAWSYIRRGEAGVRSGLEMCNRGQLNGAWSVIATGSPPSACSTDGFPPQNSSRTPVRSANCCAGILSTRWMPSQARCCSAKQWPFRNGAASPPSRNLVACIHSS